MRKNGKPSQKALFKTGDCVQYIGPTKKWNSNKELILENGFRFYIEETHEPEKGLGSVVINGEVSFDYDKDGYNVYVTSDGQRKIIWPKDKDKWELI